MARLSRTLLWIEIVFEALTGLALLAIPASVLAWLFGPDVPVGTTLTRLGGIALLTLAGGGWLATQRRSERFALAIFQLYNVPVTLLLVAVGAATAYVGPLLWPAVAAHVAVTALIFLALSRREA